jgi:hypothetical protein
MARRLLATKGIRRPSAILAARFARCASTCQSMHQLPIRSPKK